MARDINNRDKIIRSDLEFDRQLADIRIERMKKGIDKRSMSDRRITKGIALHPLFPNIKDDLIRMPRKKKGAITDLFVWIIIGFIALLFFGVWVLASGILTEAVTSIQSQPNQANISEIGQETFGQMNIGVQSLRYLVVVMFLALGISIFISNFLVKANPVFFIIYILIVVVAIIFSISIANTYEDILNSDNLISGTLASFTGGSFIFLNLPIWVTVVGVGGAIFLFIGIIRDAGLGGGITT